MRAGAGHTAGWVRGRPQPWTPGRSTHCTPGAGEALALDPRAQGRASVQRGRTRDPHICSACPALRSQGHAHPQGLSKASWLLDKRGHEAYLLVMELFLSFRASSRCCSSTMNLDRSSGVLGGQEHTGSAGCACRGRGSDPRGRPKARQATGGPQSRASQGL